MNTNEFMEKSREEILGATSPERLAFKLGRAIGRLCQYAGSLEISTDQLLNMHDELFFIAKGKAEKKDWQLDIF